MPKVTVQVSDKSLEFFHQLMKELKFKVVENGKAEAPPKGKILPALPDLMADAQDTVLLEETAAPKADKKSKGKKDKKKKKKEKG